MKKASVFIIIILAAFLWVGCSQTLATAPTASLAPEAPTSEPTLKPSPTSEMVEPTLDLLLTDSYNVFSALDWPEGYHIYQASFENSDFKLYWLNLTTEKTPEQIVADMAGMMGISDESIRAEALNTLNKTGEIMLESLPDAELPMKAEIFKIDGENYDYVADSGYRIELAAILDGNDISAYLNLIAPNFNDKALLDFKDDIDFMDDQSQEITVNTDADYTRFFGAYQLKNYDDVISMLNLSSKWRPEGGGYSVADGDLSVNITPDQTTKTLYIDQRLNHHRDETIGSYIYVPTLSLSALGFEKYDQNSAYNDEEAGVWIGVYKKEWGAESDDIKCSFTIFDKPCFIEIKYPSQKYNVMLGENDDRVDYSYDPVTDTITPSGVYEDMDDFYKDFFEKSGDEGKLAPLQPVNFVDSFAFETFGYKPEALFELPQE